VKGSLAEYGIIAMLLISRLVAALALAGTAIASLQIIPGATWTASGTNQHVQAHGGGKRTYYSGYILS
jgi:hypothetical protein